MPGPNRPSTDPPSVTLPYSIAQCSAHSGRYIAENILIDNPADQASRWSGAYQANAKQWIILRLETLAVLKTVTFGKYIKAHPCNMRDFKIYVGITDDHMSEVLRSGLRNDAVPETFHIKHVNHAGICFPTRYVKIVPLSAHGQSFHTSIWHVAMTGITDEGYVDQVRIAYDEYRETSVLRHVLKHLRQRRLLTPYQSILSRSGLQLEHPLITQLYENLVLQGDWNRAEQLIPAMCQAGLFDPYLQGAQPHALWKRLQGTDADGDIPSPRGGHAMCIDPINNLIYLFGGWDGQKSLDDFWVYSVKEEKWRVLSHSTSTEQNAPGARSCHKMVFDTRTGSIYILGRLNDSDGVEPVAETKQTAGTNPGPTTQRTTVTTPPTEELATGSAAVQGLASDSTGENTTSSLASEAGSSTESTEDGKSSPRIKTYCSEFYRYHTRGIDAGKWDFLSFDTASSGGPPLVFDHQMVMDCDSQIVYVFGGRVVDGDWNSVKYSGLYSYNVRLSKWKLLQHPDTTNTSHVVIPSRFGHSMVLEPFSRTLYIFAGQRDDNYLSDMYAYDITTNTATELDTNFTTAGGPDACFTQRAVIDPHLRELYVVCGLTRSPQAGSVTTLPSESPNWVYRYEPRPGSWMQILPAYDDHIDKRVSEETTDPTEAYEEPLPRYAHQVVYNPLTKTVYMHGGNAGMVGQMEGTGKVSQVESPVERKGEKVGGQERGKEQRLDDFWQMTLIRPGSEEIVRRMTYFMRQQQFREMCQDIAPVKALNFLQTEVSSVVDHSDPDEAETFRGLLTHLLSPQPPPSAPEKSQVPSEDVQNSQPLPRKRSRTNTPDGSWTDSLDDEQSLQPCSIRAVSAYTLKEDEDPFEVGVRDPGAPKISGSRYSQRNEVFESILRFVSDSEKQPAGSLLDMVDGDEGGL